MASIFIFHGIDGSPEENWFPWMKSELEKRGHSVIVPQFPHGKGHNLATWLEHFSKYEKDLTDDSILIGHSMAGAFMLTLLETHPVRACFLVAGFIGPLGLKVFDERNASFTEKVLPGRKSATTVLILKFAKATTTPTSL
ncbi:alpha/beta fold hydrolase [Candidatus Peregrinibacteria bacterium]|nr:MAG: alpha/beta fold hydrolase [Candidatus Peregrinibacteria bacterium]